MRTKRPACAAVSPSACGRVACIPTPSTRGTSIRIPPNTIVSSPRSPLPSPSSIAPLRRGTGWPRRSFRSCGPAGWCPTRLVGRLRLRRTTLYPGRAAVRASAQNGLAHPARCVRRRHRLRPPKPREGPGRALPRRGMQRNATGADRSLLHERRRASGCPRGVGGRRQLGAFRTARCDERPAAQPSLRPPSLSERRDLFRSTRCARRGCPSSRKMSAASKVDRCCTT